ncbi:MAG: hypothetical protein ACREIA_26815 [Opitutaceae bacterium]
MINASVFPADELGLTKEGLHLERQVADSRRLARVPIAEVCYQGISQAESSAKPSGMLVKIGGKKIPATEDQPNF